jgi:hypothetical protein
MDATTKQKMKALYNAFRAAQADAKKTRSPAIAKAADRIWVRFVQLSYSTMPQ